VREEPASLNTASEIAKYTRLHLAAVPEVRRDKGHSGPAED